jgi:hypothetical protein
MGQNIKIHSKNIPISNIKFKDTNTDGSLADDSDNSSLLNSHRRCKS